MKKLLSLLMIPFFSLGLGSCEKKIANKQGEYRGYDVHINYSKSIAFDHKGIVMKGVSEEDGKKRYVLIEGSKYIPNNEMSFNELANIEEGHTHSWNSELRKYQHLGPSNRGPL